MSKAKITNRDIQEMFHDGNLIARALFTGEIKDRSGEIGYGFQEFNNEIHFINAKRNKEGTYKNIERHGQRNRSATLLVPDVDMDLFADIGLLYSGDKSTIRAYMYHDSMSASGALHNDFYNINIDKKKFKPILSKKEFLKKYKKYRRETDNTLREHVKYNEILGNFFPESIVGLVAQKNTYSNKLKLLAAKNFLLQKYNLDLPMVIMEKGKVKTWTPNLEEVAKLINVKKSNILKISDKSSNKTKEQMLESFAKNLGFMVKIRDFAQPVQSKDITILSQNDFSSKEIIDFLHNITNISKGGKFTYGLNGLLRRVINKRLKDEGLEQVQNLDGFIIQIQDIENLIFLLNEEAIAKDPQISKISKKKVEEIIDAITQEMRNKKKQKGQTQETLVDDIRETLAKYAPESNFSRLKEFFMQVAYLLFGEQKIIKTPKVNKGGSRSR